MIIENDTGITCDYPTNNIIYNNNFNNIIDVTGMDTTNHFDNGYIDGGNYWVTYNSPEEGCEDNFCGPNQDIVGWDGICDDPYILNDDFQDNYPFVNINGWLLNRPPYLEPIEDITVNELDSVIIVAHAVDVNDDTLNYYIDDPRFTQDDSIFIWVTTFDDAGDYIFTVSACDGEFCDSTEAVVHVLDYAPIPTLSEWGMIILSLSLLAAGTIAVISRRKAGYCSG